MTGNGAEVPDYGIYKDRDWPDQDKGQAAMITRMDRDIGRLLDKLRELGIADNTLVFFTSDNGPHNEARHNLDRFKPAGPLQGIKRSMHEGGIRVPGLAWWPKHVPAGTTTDMIGYSGDWFATAAELAGAKAPAGLDSISLVPTLLGKPASEQPQHRYLYWEFYEQGSRQAVRFGKWKAIREPMLNGKIRLYDLEVDQGEVNDVANQNPEEVKLAGQYMDEAHVNHPNWQVPNVKEKGARPAK